MLTAALAHTNFTSLLPRISLDVDWAAPVWFRWLPDTDWSVLCLGPVSIVIERPISHPISHQLF
jgi:hypothetical protein